MDTLFEVSLFTFLTNSCIKIQNDLNCGGQVFRLKQFVPKTHKCTETSALRNLLPVEPKMGNSVMNS